MFCLSSTMFPPSLHKNIRELDKQISLLESECENMESRKKSSVKMSMSRPATQGKKVGKGDGEGPFVTGPRSADASHMRRNPKTTSGTRLCQQGTSNAPKKQVANRESSVTCEARERKHTRKCPTCGCERIQVECKKEKKSQGGANCVCGKELDNEQDKKMEYYVTHDKQNNSDEGRQVLHKGVLHATPCGTIEVTVTQTQNRTPGSPCKGFSGKKNDVLTKDSGCVFSRPKEPLSAGKVKNTPCDPKWSDILCKENDFFNTNFMKYNVNKNDMKGNYSVSSKCVDQFQSCNAKCSTVGDIHLKVPNLELSKYSKGPRSNTWNDENECPGFPASPIPKEQRQMIPLKRKNIENVIDASPGSESCFEKDCIDDDGPKSICSDESTDILQTLCNLLDGLRGNITEDEAKRLFCDLEQTLHRKDSSETNKSSKCKTEDEFDIRSQSQSQNYDYVRNLQRHFLNAKKLCQRLIKEKDNLTENMALKDKLLLNESNKEKEYLCTIANLKADLEKQKEDNASVRKDLSCLQCRFLNEKKVVEALRQSHAKMQDQIQKCLLENDKLKTEIRLNKLESEKFNVLLAGKDVEIKRYKDEVESIQKQITEQLAALRSNSATNEVQKAMEAIIQNSHVFSATDLDSAFSETQTDEKGQATVSKQRERLVHSSPTTSNKSSTMDSSWNHISSIHEDDANAAVLQSTADDTDGVLVQGTKDGQEDEDENDPQKVSSFVSCKTIESSESVKEKRASMISHATENSKFRKEINDLFQDIKRKCSKNMNSISSESVFIEDLISDTSEFSDVSDSAKEPSKNEKKKKKKNSVNKN
ncbi:UNVERIFIED_CONTAM: hypothetical protein PYX00_009127 [Menopon gallinae]|uniref:Uncharacterized protein n=1 Tax=Menopon gallinae TaxID=328185 RepID=A0AAW2HA38_9NEOP